MKFRQVVSFVLFVHVALSVPVVEKTEEQQKVENELLKNDLALPEEPAAAKPAVETLPKAVLKETDNAEEVKKDVNQEIEDANKEMVIDVKETVKNVTEEVEEIEKEKFKEDIKTGSKDVTEIIEEVKEITEDVKEVTNVNEVVEEEAKEISQGEANEIIAEGSGAVGSDDVGSGDLLGREDIGSGDGEKQAGEASYEENAADVGSGDVERDAIDTEKSDVLEVQNDQSAAVVNILTDGL